MDSAAESRPTPPPGRVWGVEVTWWGAGSGPTGRGGRDVVTRSR